jgi:pilus assembly protein CpaB
VSRRRRGLLLLGLALVLGGLAASDVARREAALERRLGPTVAAVVARQDLEAGTRIEPGHLALRRVPARFAPAGSFPSPAELVGLRTATGVGRGEYLAPGQVSEGVGGDGDGPPLRPGERIADVVAVGSPEAIVPGGRVDVVVTREGEAGAAGRTDLALEDVEVLAATPAQEDGSASEASPGAPRVAASLRVTVRQAVYLAAAQSFSREIRLLPRAPGDRERGREGLQVGQELR